MNEAKAGRTVWVKRMARKGYLNLRTIAEATGIDYFKMRERLLKYCGRVINGHEPVKRKGMWFFHIDLLSSILQWEFGDFGDGRRLWAACRATLEELIRNGN